MQHTAYAISYDSTSKLSQTQNPQRAHGSRLHRHQMAHHRSSWGHQLRSSHHNRSRLLRGPQAHQSLDHPEQHGPFHAGKGLPGNRCCVRSWRTAGL